MTVTQAMLRQLAAVPQSHGVYIWKDADGNVLYVGKARQLRSRMRQYTSLSDERAMIPQLMQAAEGFDYLVTESEHESLILEKNLINQYSPPFNVDFKDDKSYPFIAITKGDAFPAIKYTRERPQPHTQYFGPYTDARAARETIDIARRIVPLCHAGCAEWKRLKRYYDSNVGASCELPVLGGGLSEASLAGAEAAEPCSSGALSDAALPGPPYSGGALSDAALPGPPRSSVALSDAALPGAVAPAALPNAVKPCFDSHVGLGPGPCAGLVSRPEYAANVARIERFLNGHRREFTDALAAEIADAAADLDFERAARAKKRLDTVNGLKDRQHVVLSPRLEADCIGAFREETIAGIQVLCVREGSVVISNEFVLDKGMDVSNEELLRGFILRYYEQATSIPREIIVEALPEDAEALEGWLTTRLASRHGARVRLAVPKKGEKRELLSLAERNAQHVLMRYKVRTQYEEKRINQAMLELESALALPDAPLRIECFDISTLHGRHSVASMVVFTAGRPDKSQYRRFKIREAHDEANDFAMMGEVLARRYAPERMRDGRFGSRPDLLIVDGGKPQLTAAMTQLAALGLEGIPVAGLAKRDEELFVPWESAGPVVLPSGSAGLYLVKRVRDEAHRFAISYHRQLRGKAMTSSLLDVVDGLGAKRKQALLKAFGSMKRLRAATLDEIAAVKGIPQAVAEEVYATLHEMEL